ncbi:MAG: metallophosphoesterase [Candidatus Zixiibacteriota bacterium]
MKAFTCFLASVVLALTSGVFADDNSDSTIPNFNDGPHVYWHDDSTVTILYYCNETVDSQTVTIGTALSFGGFCDDSLTEYLITTGDRPAETQIVEGASRIMALSDIHGEYEYLVDILQKSGAIDENLRWSWGDGHLVIDGDIFDRGDMVTECLWLVYGLQQQARAAEGEVHFVLGNHELMVMRGDNRYVNDKYIEGICRKTRIKHEDLFGPDMELGRWLRRQPTLLKINDILFVHGGISPSLLNRSLDIAAINDETCRGFDLRSSQLAFDQPARFLFGGEGPFWYRGFHYAMDDDYAMATPDGIDSILSYFGVSAVVVGHTQVDSVMGLFENRVFAIDVPFEDIYSLEALLWEDGKFFRVSGSGEKMLLK